MIKKIDHIGIAVRNLDESLSMYKRVYGLDVLKVERLESINVRIAFIPLGEVLIELLEPTEPGAGRIGQFLEEKGEGFHHIALRVDPPRGTVPFSRLLDESTDLEEVRISEEDPAEGRNAAKKARGRGCPYGAS